MLGIIEIIKRFKKDFLQLGEAKSDGNFSILVFLAHSTGCNEFFNQKYILWKVMKFGKNGILFLKN